ncbi:MAG: S8 family serine peptidase, partial [Gammaproteobacteria bacterium]|nr:S8 family serine peptidase [Gammaproteobacteria bacterium]
MNNQKLIFSILIFFLIICIQNLYAVQTVFKPILSNIQNIDKIENKSKVLNDIFIFFNEKIDLDKFSGEWGLKNKYALKTPNAYVFFAQNNDHIQKILPELREKKFIDGVFQDKIVFFVPHNDLLPPEPITISDPFYFPNSRQDWYGQWHLERTNVPEVWKQGIGGKGVVVGILDSGIDYEHEDLRGNYKTESSYDFSCRYLTYYDAEHDILSCGDDDPSSESNLEHHGTQVVGLASASVNNLGVVGVAPHSKFSSLRVLPPENINSGYIQNFKIDMRSMRESGFADAMLYASDRKTSLQNRIHIKNGSFGVATPYNLYKSIVYAIEKSTKAGTIHVQSASNDRSFVMEDANKSFYLNRPEVITVAASDYYDKFASYSSFGSNVFISAPAGTKIEGIPDYSIPHNTTTKLERSQHAVISLQENDFDNNKYTRFFSGTSASAPIVSGILALAKQVNPQLNTRMAKHLLVKSSTVIDRNDNSESSQGGWQTNGAGNYFNPNYGFGLINAEKFVALARNVKGVTELKIINNIN